MKKIEDRPPAKDKETEDPGIVTEIPDPDQPAALPEKLDEEDRAKLETLAKAAVSCQPASQDFDPDNESIWDKPNPKREATDALNNYLIELGQKYEFDPAKESIDVRTGTIQRK